MAYTAFNPLQQNHLSSMIFGKYKSALSPVIHSSSFIFFPPEFHRVSIVRRRRRRRTQAVTSEIESREQNAIKAVDSIIFRELGVGFSSPRSFDERMERKPKRNEGNTTEAIDSGSYRKMGVGFSSLRSGDESTERKLKKIEDSLVKAVASRMYRKTGSGFSSLRSRDEGVERKSKKNEGSHVADGSVERKFTRYNRAARTVDSRREIDNGFSSRRFRGEKVETNLKNSSAIEDEKIEKRFSKQKHTLRSVESRSYRETGDGSPLLTSRDDEKVDTKSKKAKAGSTVNKKMYMKKAKKSKADLEEVQLRHRLDMCSKRGDVMGAILAYDLALREGMKLGQYHYNVLLYLCSSAAVGVVQPAKSGSSSGSSRSFDKTGFTHEFSNGNSVDSSENGDSDDEVFNSIKSESLISNGLSVESGGNFGGSSDGMGPDSGFSSRPSSDLGEDGADGRRSTDKMDSSSSSFLVDSGKHDGEVNFNKADRSSQFSSGPTFDGIVNGLSHDRMESNSKFSDEFTIGKCRDDSENAKDGWGNKGENGIRVSDDVKKYALAKGFEIYERMCLEKIPLSEAALTSVARMAMSMGDADMAFEMVKQMKASGINPRLRSYGPALFTFCNDGNIEKAFEVEKHMLECGVYPEEPELEALLTVSVGAGRGEKVYYLLHKLRTSMRQVSPSTADLIEKWFKSPAASRVGKRKWDRRLIFQTMENGGGGWHGLGWLGKGKWTVTCTVVGADGVCRGCGEKLATIDLDPIETENFAKSVAAIAGKRERNSSFQKFQKWLDYYGPFEAVVDAANVGLFSQRRFLLSKVNAVVNGIRQKLPSKKWPLIVVHHRRISGGKMDEPPNRQLIEKWKNADALYATPTGSNDDWYWLYAAIKFKCLIVTNDEMRDHIFQLLGNDFFPRWKERHQVHFSFCEGSPEFHMPPPCSVVIQESEKGHWHIPIVAKQETQRERTWLCATRANSQTEIKESSTKRKDAVAPMNRSASWVDWVGLRVNPSSTQTQRGVGPRPQPKLTQGKE
ncbi:uncharacterized protein LOC131223055 isoform X2 [Magnolia sinica]|uniref:uncharacterized protein LOC131223055 isoform X2 n=1 Tax=Magnolia sinica TaxID=86752 RepID=UPI002659EB85|nr:uncharacterized protein LOC131223055 isoform X2 [Magnolia sinica]